MRSCAGWGQKCPADETYPNCVNGLPYLRDKDSLPTDSVQFAAHRNAQLDPRYDRAYPGISSSANYRTGCGVKIENQKQKFLKTNGFIPNIKVELATILTPSNINTIVRYIGFYETGGGAAATALDRREIQPQPAAERPDLFPPTQSEDDRFSG